MLVTDVVGIEVVVCVKWKLPLFQGYPVAYVQIVVIIEEKYSSYVGHVGIVILTTRDVSGK